MPRLVTGFCLMAMELNCADLNNWLVSLITSIGTVQNLLFKPSTLEVYRTKE